MVIVGHQWIESPQFKKVFSQKDIKASSPKQIVLLEPLVDSNALAKYCQENQVPFAVAVNSINEAMFANALGATYMICEEDDALIVQPIAQEYLFDTRILVLIYEEKEIAKIARFGIDGVIFPEAIV